MIVSFLWYFMIYSFLGWVTEVVFHAVVKGRIINRGFLNGPLCPVYGAGMCAVLWINSVLKAEDPLILFLVGMVFATLIELTAGFILDRLFHARWWDYSSMPLNLHGYICAAFSILWGLAVVAAVKGIHPWIRTIVGLIPDTLSLILLSLLCICITVDTVVTALTIIGLNKKLKELDSISRAMRTISDRMTDIIGNNAMKNAQDIGEARVQVALGKAELRDDAGEMLKKLEKRSEEIRLSILAHKHSGAARLLNAFPTMIHKEHQEIILTLKNRISGK